MNPQPAGLTDCRVTRKAGCSQFLVFSFAFGRLRQISGFGPVGQEPAQLQTTPIFST